MPDHLPGLSGEHGAGKPLTKAEWVKRERERKALDIYSTTFSFPAVRKALNLRSNDVAEQVVRAGWERYQGEEDYWGPLYRKTMREDLRELHAILMAESREGNLAAMDRLIKIMERASKMDDLDKRKDEGSGVQVVVIDGRDPWDRGDTIEGEVSE